MTPHNPQYIAEIVKGELYGDNSAVLPEITRIITDSRTYLVGPTDMFGAITTAIADGHKYIPQMLAKGVRCFLVEHLPDSLEAPDAFFIKVKSVPQAILELAAHSLEANRSKRVIITGSYGKTPVKELLYRALTPLAKVARAPRSWNSALGLPLGILDMDGRNSDVTISEAAIDAPGQAKRLKPLLKADVGILTAIGPQHDEAFPDHQSKIREKLQLLKECRTIIFPAGDKELERLVNEEFEDGYNLVAVKDDENEMAGLVSAAMQVLGYPVPSNLYSLPTVSSRYTIKEAADNNLIIRDNFTPDLRELEQVLEFASRRFTPSHTPILLIGNLIHGNIEPEELQALYCQAEDLAKAYGIERIIAVGDRWKIFGHKATVAYDPVEDRPINSLIIAAGNGQPEVERVISFIESASHDTTLDVDLEALISNYNYYRSLLPPETGIVAMVKASAYGLGAIEIAKTLQTHGAAYLAVAVIDEGVSLRDAGIAMPIMVLNPVTNRYPLLFSNRLEPAVFSVDELQRLILEAEEFGTVDYPIHLKLDTGMHRLGFIPEQFQQLLDLLKSTRAVKVKSIFTHLATADCLDKDAYTLSQIESFNLWSTQIEQALGYKVMLHFLNTAGMMRFAESGPYHMTRLGIGLYGISPYENPASPLKPVATFRTRIISLKNWEEGIYIGYGNRGRTERNSVIATIPVGYADGIDRHLGRGKASFVVKGVECPTIGNICMDLCMIDVTNVPDVKVGDEVEIFGSQMPIERLANILDTIPYEILTSVSPRVKRQYTKK